MNNLELETYTPTSQEDWRKWLEENHQSKQSIWLIYYTKKSDNPSLTWREAVDEAKECIPNVVKAPKVIRKKVASVHSAHGYQQST